MKSPIPFRSWRTTAAIGLLLAGSTGALLGAPDRVINTFDFDISGTGTAWGNATATFDAAQDNTGNGGGSAYIIGDFALDQNTLTMFFNQPPNGTWWFPGPAFNLSDYASVDFDIKWDTTKTLSIADFNAPPAGGEGGIVIWGTDSPGFTVRPTLGSIQVPAAAGSGWARVSLPINPAISGIDPSVGIVFKKWIQAAQLALGGTYGFWVDNVTLKGTDGPPPPPTVSLRKPTPGLALIAASGGQWDRQNIRTVGNTYSWIGAPGTVSYSVNVAEHAPVEHANFQLHVYFVPGFASETRADADWFEPNVLMWRIVNNADGSAWSQLHYKTNAPDSNGIFYGAGDLQGIGNSTPLGNWTLTFNQDTNLTITTPGGGIFETNLPPAVAAIFNDNMKIYVGIVPNAISRIGQMAVVAGVKITGAPGAPAVDSNFVGQSRDPAIWDILASSPNGVLEIPTDSAYWLEWTLPALGFSPQISPSVTGPWSSPTLAGFEAGGKRRALVRQRDLPGSTAGYFRLIQRTFSKLQVLLPGETAAPGTPTGKTGTPTPQILSAPFDIVVNAVDNEWYPINNVTDTVTLSSTDASALLPADAALVGGTRTFNVFLNNTGSFTITATNVTDPTKTPGTSSPVTVAN